MDCRTNGHHFVGVHSLIGLFAKQRLGGIYYTRHTGHTAHEYEFVNLAGAEFCVTHTRLHRSGGTLKQIVRELFQFSASEFYLDVFRSGLIRRDEWQTNFVSLCAGKSDLRLLSFFLDALHCIRLASEIDAVFDFEFCRHPIDDRVVPIIAAEMGVAVSGFHFKNFISNF